MRCSLFEFSKQLLGERSVGGLVPTRYPLAGAGGPVAARGLVQRPMPGTRGGGQGGGDLPCDAVPTLGKLAPRSGR